MKKLNILIVSARPPYYSANLGKDLMNCLSDRGHSVDYLTPFPFDGMSNNIFTLYNKYQDISPIPYFFSLKGLVFRLKRPQRLYNYIVKSLRRISKYSPTLFLEKETKPGISNDILIKNYPRKNYDLLILQFWHNLFSTSTILKLYEIYHCPIFITALDMLPMTGGCIYFYDCRNFKNECNNCPINKFQTNFKQPHKNFKFKKKVYKHIDYLIFGNSWMIKHFKDSNMFEDERIKFLHCIINPNNFQFIPKEEARKRLGLPNNKFIFFAGANNILNPRKGYTILEGACRIFKEEELKSDDVLILLVGNNGEKLSKSISLNTKIFGFLPYDKLNLAYCASDVYLSPSIEDAGPSMINQALTCGTPVVAFNVGVAIDVIRTGLTGYLVNTIDSFSFYKGMTYLYNYSDLENLRLNCYNFAKTHFSPEVISQQIEDYYYNNQNE